MAKIFYRFANGHTEEIEVSEELKTLLDELDKQEKRYYWKTNKQKARAGLLTTDFSLELCAEDGHEASSDAPEPLDELIQREEQFTYCEKLIGSLTPRQRKVYVLRHIQGFSVTEIAAMFNISESAVRDRLEAAYKKTQGKL